MLPLLRSPCFCFPSAIVEVFVYQLVAQSRESIQAVIKAQRGYNSAADSQAIYYLLVTGIVRKYFSNSYNLSFSLSFFVSFSISQTLII